MGEQKDSMRKQCKGQVISVSGTSWRREVYRQCRVTVDEDAGDYCHKHVPEPMNKLQREMIAFQLREEGKTYKVVGEYFGVGAERARQMVLGHKRREEYISYISDPLEIELICSECSVLRIQNCLRSAGYSGELNEIVELGGKELRKIRNMGRKSVMTVAIALERIGKIESADRWFDGY